MITLITNIPVPYREPLHELLNVKFNGQYSVVYSSRLEPNRKWNFELGNYNHCFLNKGLTFAFGNSFMHLNFDVFKTLNRLNPKVLIVTGFYFSMLFAWTWALVKRRKIVVFIDGTVESERSLTFMHRFIRRILLKRANSFIGPSNATLELFSSYGVKKEALFKSHLFVDNGRYIKHGVKKYDLLFCGHINDNKNPMFFLQVIQALKGKGVNVSALMLGDGPDRAEVESVIDKHHLDVVVQGFIPQSELPGFYSQCRIFLFPTKNDAWGVVANEACASGLPVITTPMAGCSNDLVVDGYNGFVLPLDVNQWTDKVSMLLEDRSLYEQFSANSLTIVDSYNVVNATQGVIDAVNYSRL
jgi:glycosyltransferase involved in cell wall biosynthesis